LATNQDDLLDIFRFEACRFKGIPAWLESPLDQISDQALELALRKPNLKVLRASVVGSDERE
jgi:hypothetical protein